MADRLDGLARALWVGSGTASRRRVLWGISGLVGVGLLPRSTPARAFDGDQEVTCTVGVAAAPTVASTSLPTRVAGVYAGSCRDLGTTPAFALLDLEASGAGVATPTAGDAGVVLGAPTALPGQLSVTLVNAALRDLLDAPHAIAVLGPAGDPAAPVACGDIGGRLGGQVSDEDLVIGLRERGGSGAAGVAWLRGDADRTLIHVLLAVGLADGVGPAGTTLVINDDGVNLRGSPTTEAEVLGVLNLGARVTATGAAVDGWRPVTDPVTGVKGYVLVGFLEVE